MHNKLDRLEDNRDLILLLKSNGYKDDLRTCSESL